MKTKQSGEYDSMLFCLELARREACLEDVAMHLASTLIHATRVDDDFIYQELSLHFGCLTRADGLEQRDWLVNYLFEMAEISDKDARTRAATLVDDWEKRVGKTRKLA